jgi:Uma2 family endonuclease
VTDLVVEVLSPSTRANDLGPKRPSAGDELSSPLLPGLAVTIAALFA